jgi:hypothetical protein
VLTAWLIVIGFVVVMLAVRSIIRRTVHFGVRSAEQYVRARKQRNPRPPKTLFE